MNRFWIILAVVVVGLAGLFVLTKPDKDQASNFTGDASKIQADDHVRNKRDNKVTLIEYADFQCPACASYYPILKQVEAEYSDRVNFVFRHFPIISLHPNAFAAARASEAASSQGKFWQMHDRLFETQDAWGRVSTNQQSLFEGYAKELNLDINKFKQDYVTGATADRINRDVSSAKQFEITGTPTFVLNGQKIENPNGAADFKKVLDDALKAASVDVNKTTEDSAN